MTHSAKIFKALGHPSRLAMVHALCEGEKCVCELQELVGSDMSTVSKHLAVLREAKVVSDEKRGMQVYYSLRMHCVSTFIDCVENALKEEAS
ncbi:MAG: ArsR family transcriptional regulator [Desulfovibrio sp.]|nr:MAG: ArsR family transcriptional regulator [Desulfovibrio sp.]